MQIINKGLFQTLRSSDHLTVPAPSSISLPEKIIQFGTGVLLRGLPDFIINNANNRNVFNGKIVVVKSTASGGADQFEKQDGLYTLCIRGFEEGKPVNQNHLVSSISRVVSAADDWQTVLKCAANAGLQVIISNTTEVGIALTQDDILQSPPTSFPGKLLAFLHHRFTIFNGDKEKGLVIIPTELIPDNGKVLCSVLLALARQNNLDETFINWVQEANYFCSSLVDRIVPGKLQPQQQQQTEAIIGYRDELMIISEPYALWAIETSDEKVKNILQFALGDSSVVIAPSINKFRELKLRLLNGSHTFTCGLAMLAGFKTVKDAMDNAGFNAFIRQLMNDEIIAAIEGGEILAEDAKAFADKVCDRYNNSFIEHKWISITMQYSSKMNMRNAAVISWYVDKFKSCPSRMALGMAAHLLFMKGTLGQDGKYYGVINDMRYLIQDDNAAVYESAWKQYNTEGVAKAILSDKTIFETDLTRYPIFTDQVNYWLQFLTTQSAQAAIGSFLSGGK